MVRFMIPFLFSPAVGLKRTADPLRTMSFKRVFAESREREVKLKWGFGEDAWLAKLCFGLAFPDNGFIILLLSPLGAEHEWRFPSGALAG